MKREDISKALGSISTRHIQEAGNYVVNTQKTNVFKRSLGKVMIAAAFALCFFGIVIGMFFPFHGMVVNAYTYGTNEEITAAGIVVDTGMISDSGEMKGHPLMFYLSGKNIEKVRFSCKNQQLYFTDWTEKRDEYGLAQNFTVHYGKTESEYYYLTIDWIPNAVIRELTDNSNSTITTLPDELREDVIVMEITFANGETAIKAIMISLLDNGTFLAAFDDYEIRDTDTFVNRVDAIPEQTDITQSNGAIQNNDTAFDSEGAAVYAAKEAAKEYYSGTVFEVISMEETSAAEKEITFSVCVSKDGVIQEPNRTIFLQLNENVWEVVNEGY